MTNLQRINEELQTLISELEMELDQTELDINQLKEITSYLTSLEYKMYLEINTLNEKGYDYQ